MDTLRREREKLRKDNASLVAQLNLKAARENRLMEDYFREQVREGGRGTTVWWVGGAVRLMSSVMHYTYMHVHTYAFLHSSN